MRRFRRRRRRLAALVLLPLAVLTAATTITAAAATSGDTAEIEPSKRQVRFGRDVTLRGSFDGAANAPVQIEHRAQGRQTWRARKRTETDANGLYSARVKPRRSGDWRALLSEATTLSAGDDAVPASSASAQTGGERVAVRSRTRAKIAGRNLTVGRNAKIKGRVQPGGAGRKVTVRIGGRSITTKTDRDGTFAARWRARSTGSYKVRVEAEGNRVASGSKDSAGRVTVYRRAAASWYGPGLYGNPTACGGTLTPSTLGVAHRTMPCGTKLRLRYRGRSVAVRVIDRGPFSGNREFDLTAATKQRLGFGDTGTVMSSK